MVNPKFPDFLVRRGQSQAVCLGMAKEGRIEVTAQAPLFAEIHPFVKMLRLQLIPVCPLTSPMVVALVYSLAFTPQSLYIRYSGIISKFVTPSSLPASLSA